MRSREYTGYRHVPTCSTCDLKSICDGFYGDYVELFESAEARAISLGGPIDDPQYFSSRHPKNIHPDDVAWLER